MTPYEDLPEARNVGPPGSEFRLVVDNLAEYMHTFHLEIEGPTTLATTYRGKRCLLTFAPLQDGRLTVEVRGFTDDALTEVVTHEVGISRLLVI